MFLEYDTTKEINKNKQILYNYPPIHLTKLFETNNSQKNIQFLFDGKINIPNISLLNGGSQYTSYVGSNMCIFSKTHNILGKNFDGELVIEHKPITNSIKKFYLSIPLKTSSNIKETPIDELIKLIPKNETEFELNPLLGSQEKIILYETDNSIVGIFTNPILVKSSFTNIANGNVFFLNNNGNYNIIIGKKIQEEKTFSKLFNSIFLPKEEFKVFSGEHFKIKEGMEENQSSGDVSGSIMECSVSNLDDTQTSTVYGVDVSNMTNLQQNEKIFNLMSIMVASFIIFILINIVPYCFKSLFLILKLKFPNMESNNLAINIQVFFGWLLFFLSIILIGVGAGKYLNSKDGNGNIKHNESDLNTLYVGVLFLLMTISIYGVINWNKTTDKIQNLVGDEVNMNDFMNNSGILPSWVSTRVYPIFPVSS
jgi:hypothetical protein